MGTIGVVDFDVVDVSNLQRQVIHTTDRVGQKKTESAAQTIRALNPDVTVVPHDEMLTEANVDRLISGYDVILDGTDTFETRYTLNDAAVRARIPVVHASVFRFEGQLSVFKPFEGPCYRCLYPTPPPPELAPGCSVAGVLGVVPGVMGLLQATEALKVLLDIGDSLAGRLVIYDALDGSFQELQLRRDPHCPACGDGAPVSSDIRRLHAGCERMTAVRIPPVLRAQVAARSRSTWPARPSARSLDSLLEQYPSLRDQLLTPDGALNRFVNVYVNGRDVRYEQELATPVGAADTVVLLPAMAGG